MVRHRVQEEENSSSCVCTIYVYCKVLYYSTMIWYLTCEENLSVLVEEKRKTEWKFEFRFWPGFGRLCVHQPRDCKDTDKAGE